MTSTISRPSTTDPIPKRGTSGGSNLAGGQSPSDTQKGAAASNQPADRHRRDDAHIVRAVGANAGPGQAASCSSIPKVVALLDPALALAADVLDDIERVRIANANRLRILTTSTEDSDGEVRGFGLDETHPDVARLAAMVKAMEGLEHDAELNLKRHMRRHPLYSWSKNQRGVGDKQVARLLAAIGDPYINSSTGQARTVSALWAYCGLHVLPVSHLSTGAQSAHAGRAQLPADHLPDGNQGVTVGGAGGNATQLTNDVRGSSGGVAPKRTRGQKANWSTRAKTRAHLIAESCVKQLRKPCGRDGDGPAIHVEDCTCSPYRLVYDARRARTTVTHPEWSDGHSHNDGLRVASKAILRDLWRAAKEIHDQN